MLNSGLKLTFTIIALFYFTISKGTCSAPQEENAITKSNIKTVKICKTGDQLIDPIIELGSNESITLCFDDLSDNSTSYAYTIIHCDKYWNESGLIISDYTDGFETNPINNYQNSVGASVPYIHFTVQIPNYEVKVRISGNYVIRVFDIYNPNRIIIEQRFMVVEPIVNITAITKQPSIQSYRLTSQQLNLKVNTTSLTVSDPYSDITPIIYQNNQIVNQGQKLKPSFIGFGEIDYSSVDNLIYNGINEFRSFDINSIRFLSSGIQRIEQTSGEFNVQLKPAENNRNQKYTTQPDINGKYQIKLERSENSNIEADYVWVYFTLPYFDQLADKEVFVIGELTNWEFTNENRMNYSFERQAYEQRLQLKQGYYNYRYAVRDSKTSEVDYTFFEGNHFETENSYLILVYYRQNGVRYDRLVGVKKINTQNKN